MNEIHDNDGGGGKPSFEPLGNESACLAWLWKTLYAPDGASAVCRRCRTVRRFHRVSRRRAYACDHCGTQVFPTAGTFMERSRLDVVAWFTGARLIRTSEGRIAPRVLAEQLSVSYQTALRIKKRVLAASAAGGSDAQLLERLWQEAQGANTVDANAPALSADRSSKARDHIRAAACRTFAARGLSSTRIVDIAAEAKVSSAIIHYYYTSKDELLLAALQWAMEQTYGRIDELRAETDDPCAQLRGILELAVPSEGRLHDEVLLWLEIWVRVRSHPELLAGCVAMSDFWLASVREVIEEGASAGVFRLEIPAADVAQRLVALADGLSFRSAVGYTGMHVQRVNEMLLDFAAEQLRVPAARLRSKR